MVKISVVLDKRYKRKDNTYPLKISVYRSKTFYIPINIYVKAEEWDKVKQQLIGAKYRSLNVFLNQRKTEIQATLLSLQAKGELRSLTDQQLLKILSGENNEDRPHFFREYMMKYVSSINNERTKEIYLSTERKLQAYCDYENITFEEMNVSWFREFEKWMMKDTPSTNARSIHLRNIRTIFNAAIDDEHISCYPFRRFKIKHEETKKRSISVEQMRAIRDVELPDWQVKYRDCFLLMFYLIGINIADLSKLQVIEEGRINYVRSKTHKKYSIKVEPEAQELIDKYKGDKHLLCWFDNIADYRHFSSRLNLNLAEIGNKLGIANLTTYVSRHTWSTIASDINIPHDVIAKALGHHTTVTDTYIRFNYDKVDKANREIIDYFLGK